jgi:hypothetical protein
MLNPEPILAPVILPLFAPMIQLNELPTDAVKLIFGLVSLQVVAVLDVVTDGVRFTVHFA